jgi:hypothetical protein
MGLGPYPVVTLECAREKALDAQRLKVDWRDPLIVRDGVRATEQLEAAKAITFKDAAEKYIAVHNAEWKSEKHAAQWSATSDLRSRRPICLPDGQPAQLSPASVPELQRRAQVSLRSDFCADRPGPSLTRFEFLDLPVVVNARSSRVSPWGMSLRRSWL